MYSDYLLYIVVCHTWCRWSKAYAVAHESGRIGRTRLQHHFNFLSGSMFVISTGNLEHNLVRHMALLFFQIGLF